MNIIGRRTPWIVGSLRKRAFVPPTAPTAVTFQSLTANGTSGSVSSTQLTATFSEDPGLTTNNFVVTGASKGVVSKVDNVYTINIHTITVSDQENASLELIDIPSGFTITPTLRFVAVNVADIAGQGAQIEMPSDYYQDPEINLTGVVVDDITVFETPDTVPKSIQLSVGGHIRVAGTRLFDSEPITPELDCDIRWLLTDEDDNPLEDLEEMVRPNTATPYNPYTEQIGFEFSAIGRLPITYKAKVFVRGINGEFAREATFEKLIGPVSDNTLPERWVDGDDGLDTNDGLSPYKWEGTATYTDSTKRIFATGMFASYDHAAASAGNVTNRYNCGYITGGNEAGVPVGRIDIAAKISDDEIELVNALGADYTGITFSTGPKLTPTVTTNIRHRIKGGVRKVSSPLKAGYTGKLEYIAYAGAVDLQRVGSGSYIFDYRAGSSNEVGGVNWFIASNINPDGEWINASCGGTNSSIISVADHTSLWDRVNIKRSNGGHAFLINFSGENDKLHKQTIHWQGGGFDHRYLDSGAAAREGSYLQTNTGARWRFGGVDLKADGDSATLHHYLYTSGDQSHAHAFCIDFGEGAGASFAINTNFNTTPKIDSKYISYVDNYVSENLRFGFDASKTNPEFTDEWGDIMLIARNRCAATDGLFSYASMKRARLAQNEAWSSTGASGHKLIQRFLGWDLGESPRYQVFSNGNKSYGFKLQTTSSDISELYSYGDVVQYTTDDDVLSFPNNGKITVNNANLYAPARAGGLIATIGGVGKTVEDLNAEFGSNNISQDPGWNDPANGDFDTGRLYIQLGTDKRISYSTGLNNDKVTNGGELSFNFSTASTSTILPVVGASNSVQLVTGSNLIRIRHTFGTTVDFPVDEMASIVADGQPHKVEILPILDEIMSVWLDGVQYTVSDGTTVFSSSFFISCTNSNITSTQPDFKLWDVKLANATLQSFFPLSSGSTVSEENTQETGSAAFIGIVEEDWTESNLI